MIIRIIHTFLICFLVSNVEAKDSENSITFCLDADNAPFSSRSDQNNINTDIIKAIAEKMQRTLQVQWVDVPMRGGLSRAVKQAFSNDTCDAFLGVPVEEGMSAELAESDITLSSPYLSVGYVAISTKALAEKINTSPVEKLSFGASSATPADLFLLHNQLNRIAYGSNPTLLDALRNNSIDVALIWSPSLVGENSEFVVNKTLIKDLNFIDPLSWKISMAVKAQADSLKNDLNLAIETLHQEGRLDPLTEGKGLVQFENANNF